MRGKLYPLHYVLLALVAIGFVYQTIANPFWLLVPLIVFGVIFFLYKFPPARFGAGPRPAKRYAPLKQDRMQAKARKRKTAPFRVIEGGKDDDNLPKYH